MHEFTFSPITHDEAGIEALRYIEQKLNELASLVLDEKLPINTLKIFAHYDNEHAYLKTWLNSLGEPDEMSASSYYVKTTEPLTVNNSLIHYVGIRIPDTTRPQVGCGDFVVDDYEAFKHMHLNHSPFVRELPHPKYEMLELFHPDIDVLGYVVKEQ